MTGDGWEELVGAALLGTGRRPTTPSDLPAALRPLLVGSREPADALLTAAAALTGYRRAGQLPVRPGVAPPAAPRDARPVVPPAARRRLARLLAARPDLLGEWVQAVARAGLRVPPEQLPALLDAARSREVKAAVAAVAGEIGAWLGARNPNWSFLASGVRAGSGADVWSHGDPTQRREWFSRALVDDPEGAREALAVTWAEEPAAVRAEFLDVLGAHLRPEDEPFLEAALDDRAAPVREAAAALLPRLPGSRLVQRMRERARELVRPQPHGPGLAVTLPGLDDPALVRDRGGPQVLGGGQPAALLESVVAATPLAHWARYGPPDELLGAPVTGCDPAVLLQGWAAAAARQRDVGWASAVLAALRPHALFDPTVAALIAALPDPVQAGAVAALATRLPPESLAGPVGRLPAPWSAALGTVLLDWLGAHPAHRGLAAPAAAVSRLVPRECLRHRIATEPVPPGAAPWWRQLATTLTFRREMHEELA